MFASLCSSYKKVIWLLLVSGALGSSASAQLPSAPPPPKAPPLDFAKTLDADGFPTVVDANDRNRILQEHNEKDRLRFYMALMDQYRDQARRQVTQNQFADAINSLCAYAGVAKHAVHYLATDVPQKKRESPLKKLEMDIRSDLLYFEPMLRDFNYYNAENAAALVDMIKGARVDALNASFGGDILHKVDDKPANP